MEFDLGPTKFKTSTAVGHPDFETIVTKFPNGCGRQPRQIYKWSCGDGADNGAMPRFLTLDATLFALELKADGTEDTAKTAQKVARLKTATGSADTDAIQRRLDAVFPPVTIEIPRAAFAPLFDNVRCSSVYAFVEYRDLMIAEDLAMPIWHYMLSLPVRVVFLGYLETYCAEVLQPPASGLKVTRAVKIPTPATGTKAIEFWTEWRGTVRREMQADAPGFRQKIGRIRTAMQDHIKKHGERIIR